MTEFIHDQSDAKEPDEFYELVGELHEQFYDPYLLGIHTQALDAERVVGESQEEDTESLRNGLVRHLDANWRYMNEKLEVSGVAWTHSAPKQPMHPQTLVNETVVSRGFIFFCDVGEDSHDLSWRIGHMINLVTDEGLIPGVMCLKDEPIIRLPYPSPELREQRFAYDHPDDAQFIDQLIYSARRDDQVIKELEYYYYDANFDDHYSTESVRDGAQYIRTRIEIEPETHYSIALTGPFLVVDEDGNGIPGFLRSPLVQKMKIIDVALRPDDVTVGTLEGEHRCVPYVVAKTFAKNPSSDKELLFPCSSILWMSSERYDTPTPPTFD